MMLRSHIELPLADLVLKALASPEAQLRRHTALAAVHMRPLVEFVNELRAAQPHCYVPDFDPAGGGIRARALFLFEKPGPKTDARNGGSGFISIHNNDDTAAATHRFLALRRIPVDWCLFANAIPWWDDRRDIRHAHRALAIAPLKKLVRMLPELRAIVLVGKTAQDQWLRAKLEPPPNVSLYFSDHPSPIVRARWPQRWERIPEAWPDLRALGDT
jgi:hypothetical protein